jgi:Transposase DDE domain
MEQWAKDWLEGQRRQGVKCLEIKVSGKNHYVYYSTTHWDKDLKKAVKTSDYLGKLDPVEGFVESRSKKQQSNEIRNVREYGNSMLLHESLKEIKPILAEAFPESWEEIYCLAMVRVQGYVPLKRAESAWDKLYNAEGINPNLSPKNISNVLREVGVDRIGQDLVFSRLMDQSQQLVYDLTCMFSRSMSISQAEKGYNKDKIQVPQINLALLCNAESGLPAMIRSLPGSLKDIRTLHNSISELDIRDKVLILDRGFFSEEVMQFLASQRISYIIPARRNSNYYKTRIHLNEHFYYRERLIRCGRRKDGDKFLYLFEDQNLMVEENDVLYRKLDDGKISREELRDMMKRSGRILLISNLDVPVKEIYELYKKREQVEQLFDSYKSALSADRLYLRDNESVFAHVFVSFLSLYAYSKIELALKKADLNSRFSPIDVLFEFSKVYHYDLGGREQITEVPKRVLDIEAKLGLDIFPIFVRS